MTFDVTMTVAGAILAGLIVAVMLAAPIVLFLLRFCLNMDHENAPKAFGVDSLVKFVPKFFKVEDGVVAENGSYYVKRSDGKYFDASDNTWGRRYSGGRFRTRNEAEEQAAQLGFNGHTLLISRVLLGLLSLVAGGLLIDIALAAFAHSPVATISIAGTVLTVFGTRYLAGKVWNIKGRMGKVETDVETIREDLDEAREQIQTSRTIVKI